MTETSRVWLSYVCSACLHGGAMLLVPCTFAGADLHGAERGTLRSVARIEMGFEATPDVGIPELRRTNDVGLEDREPVAVEPALAEAERGLVARVALADGVDDDHLDRVVVPQPQPQQDEPVESREPTVTPVADSPSRPEHDELLELEPEEPEPTEEEEREEEEDEPEEEEEELVQVVQTHTEQDEPEDAEYESLYSATAEQTAREAVTSVNAGLNSADRQESMHRQSGVPAESGDPGVAARPGQPSPDSVAVDAVAAVEGQAGTATEMPSWWMPMARRFPVAVDAHSPTAAHDRDAVAGSVAQRGSAAGRGGRGATDEDYTGRRDWSTVGEGRSGMGNEVGLSGSEGEREAEPREGEPGVLGAPSSGGLASHAGASSQLVMDAESGPSQVNAIATARGAYIQRVDGQLQNAWMERPIPVELIARGVKGSVTVRFEIARGGRVSDVRLTGTSGNEWLDVLAFQVVPERLPRVPVDVPAPLLHEVTLHLR